MIVLQVYIQSEKGQGGAKQGSKESPRSLLRGQSGKTSFPERCSMQHTVIAKHALVHSHSFVRSFVHNNNQLWQRSAQQAAAAIANRNSASFVETLSEGAVRRSACFSPREQVSRVFLLHFWYRSDSPAFSVKFYPLLKTISTTLHQCQHPNQLLPLQTLNRSLTCLASNSN